MTTTTPAWSVTSKVPPSSATTCRGTASESVTSSHRTPPAAKGSVALGEVVSAELAEAVDVVDEVDESASSGLVGELVAAPEGPALRGEVVVLAVDDPAPTSPPSPAHAVRLRQTTAQSRTTAAGLESCADATADAAFALRWREKSTLSRDQVCSDSLKTRVTRMSE